MHGLQLYDELIENVEFRGPYDRFQSMLQKNIAYVRGSQAVFVPVNKTINLYRLEEAQYEKLLRENPTIHYRSQMKKLMPRLMRKRRLLPANLALLIDWVQWPRERHS